MTCAICGLHVDTDNGRITTDGRAVCDYCNTGATWNEEEK